MLLQRNIPSMLHDRFIRPSCLIDDSVGSVRFGLLLKFGSLRWRGNAGSPTGTCVGGETDEYNYPFFRFALEKSQQRQAMSYKDGKWLSTTKDNLTGLDNLFLLMADNTDFNPACAATYTFRGKVDPEVIKTSFSQMSERFPRYRKKLTDLHEILHGASFVDDPDFSIDNHINVVRLKSSDGSDTVGKDEFEAFVGDFIAQPWDLSRPLWNTTIVENYKDDTGALSAMVTRGMCPDLMLKHVFAAKLQRPDHSYNES